jgi:probable F420-dependent oxidoreductase
MRYGLTLPLEQVPLADQRDLVAALPDLGYTDAWSSETAGADAFTPLVLASQWAPALRLGTAIVPVHTRGAAVLAQSFAALAAVAPGRVVAGIGASSKVIVEAWNSVPYEEPYARVRDTLRFLRAAFAGGVGGKVDLDAPTLTVRGFRPALVPDPAPPIVVAALRPGMLRLAGREADGAILNWLGAGDVAQAVAPVREAARQAAPESAQGQPREIVARVFVAPVDDPERVRPAAKMALAAYLTVPAYAAFHEWLGNGDRLARTWELWAAGDRKGAAAAIPDSLVDELVLHGSAAACREHVARYVEAGVDTPVLALLPFGYDMAQAVRDLAPR